MSEALRSNVPFHGKTVRDFLKMPTDWGDAYTTSVTASRLDLGRWVRMDSGSAMTYTIPPDSSVQFQDGEFIMLVQKGAGQVTVTAGSGVTINSAGGLLATSQQYSTVTVVKEDANTWIAFGDRA